MHDLNDALDELRAVIPYAHGPSVRKLSKIATLLLAKNYILMQARALDELRRLVGYMNHTAAAAVGIQPRPPPTGLPGPGAAAAAATASLAPAVRPSLSTAGDGYHAPDVLPASSAGVCYGNVAGGGDAAELTGEANDDVETRQLANYSPS